MKKFNFHVKPIGLLDMLHFKQMVPRRRSILAGGSLDPITAVYGVNRLAQSLHPKMQKAVVSEIIPRKDAKTFVLKADKLAYFRAGQYVSVKLKIGDAVTARPYTLAGAPLRALVFDSRFDIFRGVVIYIRVVDGAIKAGDAVTMMAGVRAMRVFFRAANRAPDTKPTHSRGRKATNTLAKPKGL